MFTSNEVSTIEARYLMRGFCLFAPAAFYRPEGACGCQRCVSKTQHHAHEQQQLTFGNTLSLKFTSPLSPRPSPLASIIYNKWSRRIIGTF